MTRCAAALTAILLLACGKNHGRDTPADASIAHDAHDATVSADAEADADADAEADAGADADAEADAGADADAEAEADAAADADASSCAPPLTTADAGGPCSALVQSWPDEGHTHVAEDAGVHYCSEPPNSGNHYPYWANFTTYDRPIAAGYLVHAMEHGAVVITYRCASSCPDVASQLQAVIDAHPLDPLCDGTIKSRLILAPDPTLDVAVAAAAWQWTYRASCVDTSTLTAFVNAHYGQGTEATCAPGIVPP